MADPIPPAPERFYANVCTVIELARESSKELREKGGTSLNDDVIDIAAGVLSRRARDNLIQLFIEKGHAECWDKVIEKDSQFFLANADRLFGSVQGFDLNVFQDVFRKDASGNFLLSATLIEDVWDTMSAMVRISIVYIHSSRKPKQMYIEGQLMNCYTANFLDQVNIPYHAQKWGISLNFAG